MLSSLSGGGIAYKLELEIIRSPSTSWASQSSSPSSTLSENSNSPVAISTRKPRTPRKRPNQTYNEAAALLSTAYPKIFSATVRNPPGKFTRPNQSFSGSSSDLLLPFSALDGGCDGFLLQSPVERILNRHPAAPRKLLAGCGSPREIDSNSRLRFEDCDEFEEDFESESILDEEIEEGGIDSIMGKLNESNDSAREAEWMSACYGFPIGMGFKAIKQADNGDWWRFPVASINVADITPKTEKSPAPATEKKKKKKKVEKPAEFRVNDKECSSSSAQSASKEESSNPKAKSAGLLLKLNYDSVLSEWTDRPSPFSDESPCSDAGGTDVQTRLTQIDLFLESGVREASVLRYKEKRRTRLFSKKIRYQVRKVNADRRPRMKGRFVKSPNSPDDSEQG